VIAGLCRCHSHIAKGLLNQNPIGRAKEII
jgi:hypothetical protein